MKLNLFVCVKDRVNSVWFLFCSLVVCVIRYSIKVLMVMMMIVMFSIVMGCWVRMLKFIFVFMVMKKIFSSSFLKGVIWFLSLCWNFEFVSIMLVRNVLSVGERFIIFISEVMLIMISSVRVVFSLFSLVE